MSRPRIQLGTRSTISARTVAVLLVAIVLGAVFVAATLILASCSGKVDASLRPDGGLRLSVTAAVPAPLAAKLRRLGTAPIDAPIFDTVAIRKALSTRPGTVIRELSRPNPDSIRAEIEIGDLAALAEAQDIEASGLLVEKKTSDWTELRLRFERSKAQAGTALIPGIDPDLLAALAPPALDEDPLTKSEYREVLGSLLGEKALPALEAASVELRISAPSEVLASGGGRLAGSTLEASIPILDLLVLEKPIEVWLRWKAGQ